MGDALDRLKAAQPDDDGNVELSLITRVKSYFAERDGKRTHVSGYTRKVKDMTFGELHDEWAAIGSDEDPQARNRKAQITGELRRRVNVNIDYVDRLHHTDRERRKRQEQSDKWNGRNRQEQSGKWNGLTDTGSALGRADWERQRAAQRKPPLPGEFAELLANGYSVDPDILARYDNSGYGGMDKKPSWTPPPKHPLGWVTGKEARDARAYLKEPSTWDDDRSGESMGGGQLPDSAWDTPLKGSDLYASMFSGPGYANQGKPGRPTPAWNSRGQDDYGKEWAQTAPQAQFDAYMARLGPSRGLSGMSWAGDRDRLPKWRAEANRKWALETPGVGPSIKAIAKMQFGADRFHGSTQADRTEDKVDELDYRRGGSSEYTKWSDARLLSAYRRIGADDDDSGADYFAIGQELRRRGVI